MTTLLNDLDQMSDDELIAMENGKHPPEMLNAQGTITTQDIKIQAKIILHKRQKQKEQTTRNMTLWILVFTIALTILTAILAYFAFFDRPISELRNTLTFSQPKQLPPEHKNTEPSKTEKKK